MASRSRNLDGDPSEPRAARSSSGRAVAHTARAVHFGLEDPSLDVDTRRREVPREALEARRLDFRERFGRNPEPDDPLLFDPTGKELALWTRTVRPTSPR